MRVGDVDTDTTVGELLLVDATYQAGPTVRTRDWVFALVQPSAAGADSHFFIAGFHQATMYRFDTFPTSRPSDRLRSIFLSVAVD